jgi:hypothetical protein
LDPNTWVGGYAPIPICISPLLKRFTGCEIKVFLYIHSQAWRQAYFDHDITITLADIVSETGVSRTKVYGAIEALCNEGYLRVQRSPGKPSYYEPCFPDNPVKPLRSLAITDADESTRSESEPLPESERVTAQPLPESERVDSAFNRDKPSKDKPTGAREENPEPQPITEGNLIKGIRRYAGDLGNGTSHVSITQDARRHLSGQERRARAEGQEEFEQWRAKVAGAVRDYWQDQSIGTLSQALRKCWANGRSRPAYQPPEAAEPASGAQAKIKEYITPFYPSVSIMAWMWGILEFSWAHDRDAFIERLAESLAESKQQELSADGAIQALVSMERGEEQRIRRELAEYREGKRWDAQLERELAEERRKRDYLHA